MTLRMARTYLPAILFWLVATGLALSLGAVSDANFELISEIRLPRVILASAVGMGLAVAGASLQALFSNVLCEPYTLGVSSGAALGAVIGSSLGLEWMFAGLAGTAFLGAFVFATFLYLISLRPGAGNVALLLAGVMLGFLGSSLVALWIALSDSNGMQSAMVWLFGDLSRARMSGSVFTLFLNLALIFGIWTQSRDLDALLMGEEDAATLGVDVSRTRRRLILLTSLVIGLCVSAGGVIGFVGLVVPHFARRLVGSMHYHLIPICMIFGAAVLTGADCISRVLARPYELPVGVVTALVGAPVFLWVMLKRSNANHG